MIGPAFVNVDGAIDSRFKTLTKVEVTARHPTPEATCTVIDGYALLWIPQWPTSTSTHKPIVMDFVKKFKCQKLRMVTYI